MDAISLDNAVKSSLALARAKLEIGLRIAKAAGAIGHWHGEAAKWREWLQTGLCYRDAEVACRCDD